MSFKLLIADENKDSRDLIKFKIESVFDNQAQLVSSCSNPSETIGCIFIHQPDIVVLDIKMFEHHHLTALERLLTYHPVQLKVIIIATEKQLPLIQRVVEIGIAGLLIKPVSTDDLQKSLTKILSKHHHHHRNHHAPDEFITFKSNRAKLLVNQQDILIIESQRNISKITLHDGSEKTINENITSIENRLTIRDLQRVDKSTIINTSKIIHLDNDIYNKSCKLRLASGDELIKPLSKAGVERLYKMTINK